VIRARVNEGLVGSEVPASTRAAPTEARPAANASQRSCWRSSPRARRNRTTSEPHATGTVSRNTTGAAPRALAHQRQRRDGDGSDPLGVSSSTKPAQASPAMKTAGL
jgi:hypothetical protein